MEQKPIINIKIADKIHFEQKNISFILFEDNKVFIFNYVSKNVICIYQPPILGHDHAVGFALHCSARYFASVSDVLFSVVVQGRSLFGKSTKVP